MVRSQTSSLTAKLVKYDSQHENTRKQVIRATFLLLSLSLIGTLGYYILEDWPVIDAFYMTIITIATVGYGETHSLSQEGRMFTVALIISSLGVVGYGVSSLAAFILEGEFQQFILGRNMDKRIAKISNHIIICGAGHNGKCTGEELYRTKTPFVIVENNPESLEYFLQMGDVPFVQGDATHDGTLVAAGIRRAWGLIAALSDDKENTFVVLTARFLNPNLRIIARNVEEMNAEKLRKAGADEVISPNHIGGLRMASMMIRPSVVRFLDAMLTDKKSAVRFEEIRIREIPSLINLTLEDARITVRTGLIVLALVHEDGSYLFNPTPDTKLQETDTLVVMGCKEHIRKLRESRFTRSKG